VPGETNHFLDADFPADPYPGGSPACSFVHLDGVGHRLAPDPTRYAADMGTEFLARIGEVASAALTRLLPEM